MDNADAIRQAVSDVSKERPGLLSKSTIEIWRDERIKGRRILVIDDEPVIRQTIGDLLRRLDSAVDGVADGNEAVQMIEQNDYDLVISDIKMPGKNGYEIFAAAKEASATGGVTMAQQVGGDHADVDCRVRDVGGNRIRLIAPRDLAVGNLVLEIEDARRRPRVLAERRRLGTAAAEVENLGGGV